MTSPTDDAVTTVDRSTLPDYASLETGPHGGPVAWNLFGKDDHLGLVNLLTADAVAHAASLVRTGSVFALNAPMDLFNPSPFVARSAPRHSIRTKPRPALTILDDCLDNFFPQVSSQWDSLAHASVSGDMFYNGASRKQIIEDHRNTIDHWATRGIVGRAVVLDLVPDLPVDGSANDDVGGAPTEYGVDELEAARLAAGIEYREGDILLLHTGFADWYSRQGLETRTALQTNISTPGLAHTEEIVRYLWDNHFAAVATDTLAVESMPYDSSPSAQPFGFLHQTLIGGFGMALGELWWLRELVADCRRDGSFEAMLVSAPLNVPGGIGSPANAVAIK